MREAARLFAERGFRGTTIEDIGSAVGITGPGVYKHFASKDAVLADMLVGISERLLAGGRLVVVTASSAEAALEGLVRFHCDFALADPDLIRVHDRDLAALPPTDARHVRRLQRAYVEVWVGVLQRLHPELQQEDARTAAHAALGLLNSTPYTSAPRADVLQALALGALGALDALPVRPSAPPPADRAARPSSPAS